MSIKSITKELVEIQDIEKKVIERRRAWKSKAGVVLLQQLVDDKWEVFDPYYNDFVLVYKGKISTEAIRIFNEAKGYQIGPLAGNIYIAHGKAYIKYTGIFTGEPNLSKFVLELRNLGIRMSMKTVEEALQSAITGVKELEEEIKKWRDATDIF